jgi:hypothetical protein
MKTLRNCTSCVELQEIKQRGYMKRRLIYVFNNIL